MSMNRWPVWAETVYDLLTGMKKVGLSTMEQRWVANADLVKHGILITIFIQYNVYTTLTIQYPFRPLSIKVSAGDDASRSPVGVVMKLHMGATALDTDNTRR
jgi:hypothetical protein